MRLLGPNRDASILPVEWLKYFNPIIQGEMFCRSRDKSRKKSRIQFPTLYPDIGEGVVDRSNI